MTDETIADEAAERRDDEHPAVEQDVGTILEDTEDVGVRARTAHARRLELGNERRLRVSGRRLRPRRRDLDAGSSGRPDRTFRKVRHRRRLVDRRRRRENEMETRRDDGTPLGDERHTASGERSVEPPGGAADARRVHLRSEQTPADEIVERSLRGVGDRLGTGRRIGRPHGLVRLLGTRLRGVPGRLRRHRVGPERGPKPLARGLLRGLCHEDGVRTHVGDAAGLVERLREAHRVRDRELEERRRRLLEGRGRERGLRALQGIRALDGAKRDRGAGQGARDAISDAAVVEAGHTTVGVYDGSNDGIEAGNALDGQRDVETVELGRPERADLAVAVDQDTERHRLHASGGERRREAPREQRRHRVADETVKETTCLLGVDQGVVDTARSVERRTHGVGRDLGEGDAAEALLGTAEKLAQVPGDGLALTVEVGRQVDGTRCAGTAELRGDGLLPGYDLVVGSPAARDVKAGNGASAGGPSRGQIPDVADGGTDEETIAQNGVDLAGLARGLDDDEGCHGWRLAYRTEHDRQDPGIERERVRL